MRPAIPRLLVLTLALGCESLSANPTPRTRLHFPGGLAIDVPYSLDGGIPHTLYVAGDTNYDLAYDTGLLYALNLDAMDGGATGLIPTALALDAGWDGTPVQIPDLDSGGYWDRTNGVVLTDSMGGELRLTQIQGGAQRLFLASRYNNVVTAIETAGDALTCYGGGTDCTNQIAAPPLYAQLAGEAGNQIIDVFGLSNEIDVAATDTTAEERDIFITHLRDLAYASGGVTSTGSYGNNTNQAGEAYVIRQNVDDPACRLADPIGEQGGSASVAFTSAGLIYTLTTGRYGGLDNSIRELTLPAGGCADQDAGTTPVDANLTPELSTLDLSYVLKGDSGRGITISTSGDRIFAIVRDPDSLVVLRNDGFLPVGLQVHVSTTIPLPPGPAEVLAIPRVNAAGQPIGDLVAVTCADSDQLALYDDELGMLVASLPGVGNEPFGMVAAARTIPGPTGPVALPGVRIYLTAFGSGQITAVDIPDPLNANSAQVVAVIGTYEDTSVSPISPSNNIFTTSTVSGPTGIP